MKWRYQSSRGWLNLEAFETFNSREARLTVFDEDGSWRSSWGTDAIQQPDFDVSLQLVDTLRDSGFPESEAEQLAAQMQADLQRFG